MNDCIFINDLTVETIIGILPNERITKQPVTINLKLFFNFSVASYSDDFNDTIDYADVTKQLRKFIEHSNFQLIEKLAESISRWLFDHYPVDKVEVHLTKPNALKEATVGVIIERQRNTTAEA